MKIKEAPTRCRKKPRRQGCLRFQGKSRGTISALTATLLSVVCVMILCADTVSSQNPRRQMRIQRKIDKKTSRPADNPDRLTPSNSAKEDPVTSDQPEATAPRIGTQGNRHSL
ncbi:MAG: hypothetical protein ACREA2_15200, partial [Blastocatellia bacterium]